MAKIRVRKAARSLAHNIKAFWVTFDQKDRYLTEFVASVCSFLAGVIASMSPEIVGNRTSMTGFTNMLLPELWITLMVLPGLVVVGRNWWYRRIDEDHDIAPVIVMVSFLVLTGMSALVGLSNWVFWTFLLLQLGVCQGYALHREWTDLRWGVAVIGSFFWISLTINVLVNAEWPWAIGIVGYIGLSLCNILTSSRLSEARRQNMRIRGVAWNANG